MRAAGCDMQGSMYDVINNLTAEIEKQHEVKTDHGRNTCDPKGKRLYLS